MIGEYRLVGLTRANTAVLEFFDRADNGESFYAHYQFPESLWNYCHGHWSEVDLKAIVHHDGVTYENPINPTVIEIHPI